MVDAIRPEDLEFILYDGFGKIEKAELMQDLVDDILPYSFDWNSFRKKFPENMAQNIQNAKYDTFFKCENPLEDVSGMVEYFSLDDFVIVGMPQNTLIYQPLENNPLFYTTINSCSILVAQNENNLYGAHIGYSERNQVKETLRYFEEIGISAKDISVVLPVKEGGWGMGFERDRVCSEVSDYLDLGIERNNILDYEGAFNKAIRVLSTKNEMITSQYDIEQKRTGWDYNSIKTIRNSELRDVRSHQI